MAEHPSSSSSASNLKAADPPTSLASLDQATTAVSSEETVTRDWKFWGVLIAIMISLFTSALDLTAVSTALPIISNDLHGSQFIWVGSAYALSSTAFLPMSGGLAQVFGRRPVMIGSLLIFAAGSAMCGAAPSMNFLIAARTIQGLGAGGITSLTQIILSDLVPLRERGTFNGLVGLGWSVASFIGPVAGGSLAERGAWRWLFYLNIFTSAISCILVWTLLRLKTPPGTLREKLARMDWIGNFIIVAATTSCIIALTWGGVTYPWRSAKVLVPLVLGLVGLSVFLVYEATYATHPIVPYSLMTTRTGLSGYIQTFLAAIVLLAVIYYIPVYFQACKDASPIASGVDIFGLAFLTAPSGIIAGISVAKSKHYRPQIVTGWCLSMIGTGLLSTLKSGTGRGHAIGFEMIVGAAAGILSTTTYFPVLAPLPVTANANALAFFTFVRSFGQVWGITIGGAILQNELAKQLSSTSFSNSFPQGTAIAYALIPLIKDLPPDLKNAVQNSFARALVVVWQVVIGISAIGLIASLAMEHLPLHTSTDKDWGMEMKNSSREGEHD